MSAFDRLGCCLACEVSATSTASAELGIGGAAPRMASSAGASRLETALRSSVWRYRPSPSPQRPKA
jgi:hypothetical protein